MVRIAVITATLFLGALAGFSQTVGDYRTTSTATSSWTSATNWERFDGSTWLTNSGAPVSTVGTTITVGRSMTTSSVLDIKGALIVNSGVTLTIGNTAAATGTTADFAVSSTGTLTNNGTITFATSGATVTNPIRLTVNGTLTNNGLLTITANNVVVTINGTLKNSLTVNSNATAKLVVSDGGTYEHLLTTSPGALPLADWKTNSTCLISGYTTNTTVPGRLNSSFGNFTWNTPALSVSEFNLGGQLIEVAGTLTISSTGSSVLYLGKSDSEPVVLSIGGDFIISGTSAVNVTQDALGNNISIGGNLTHSSSAALNAATGSGSTDISIGGNFKQWNFQCG